jgi:hypothetical protein
VMMVVVFVCQGFSFCLSSCADRVIWLLAT